MDDICVFNTTHLFNETWNCSNHALVVILTKYFLQCIENQHFVSYSEVPHSGAAWYCIIVKLRCYEITSETILEPKQWLDSRYPHQHKLSTFLPTLHLSALVLASQSIAWRIYCSWMYGFNQDFEETHCSQPSCYGISPVNTLFHVCTISYIFTQSCNSLYVHEEFTVMSGIQKRKLTRWIPSWGKHWKFIVVSTKVHFNSS